MKFFTESDHARECQKEEGKMVTVHWTGIFWFINRTVYSPEKYLALYHVSCYVPKPRISSVKTPGSLSIKHHSPPPDAMMLDSTTQRSVPEVVLLRLVSRVFSWWFYHPTWRPGNQQLWIFKMASVMTVSAVCTMKQKIFLYFFNVVYQGASATRRSHA